MTGSRRGLDVLLIAAAAALAGFAMLRGINPHDEGLVLAAADRIARGELPWRDFWWNYGPGEPYLLAGLQELFGRSLLTWRIVHVALAALAALLAHRLVRREAPLPYALATALCVAAALSFPLIPNPLTPALTLALGGLAAARRRPLLAGVLAGLAIAFRPDVGLAAVLATALAALEGERRRDAAKAGEPEPGGKRAITRRQTRAAAARAASKKRVIQALAGAVVAAVAVNGPVILAAGVGRWADQTIGFATGEQSLQRLPLPFSADGDDLNKAFEHVFPTLVLAGLLLVVSALAYRLIRSRRRPTGLALWALPLALAGALYVLARADEFHVTLLQTTLPLIAAPLLAAERRQSPRAWPLVIAAAIALALPVAYSLDRKGVQALRPERLTPLRVDVADGVRAQPRDARALARLVPLVRRLAPRGRPVFIANPRHDVVRVGDPLLSVLIGRPNPTRYLVMQPGVVTERAVQREIVADLRRSRTRVIVRWRSPVADEREPNGAGRSSGVRVLDRYIASAYRPVRRIGYYEVLVARRGRD